MLQVKEFMAERGLSQRDIVLIAKEEGYRGFDKHLLSKVANPDKYGVRMVDELEFAINEAYATAPQKPARRDYHKDPYRVQCRMSKRQYERLQQARKKNGYASVQELLAAIIGEWLNNV